MNIQIVLNFIVLTPFYSSPDMKISFFSFRDYEIPFYKNNELRFQFFTETLTEKNMKLAEGSEVLCCFVNDKLNHHVLSHLANSGLKLIALRCAGFNNVDLESAKKLNIQIARVPAYSPNAVAEHAVALLLSLNRKIHKAYNRVREGNFSLENLTGFDLFGSKVGVIGTGKIGTVFAKIMQGFGAEVSAYDPFPKEELTKLGIQYKPLKTILNESRVLSLHLPLTKESKHIINSDSISEMKEGVFLINTSRGGLIETKLNQN